MPTQPSRSPRRRGPSRRALAVEVVYSPNPSAPTLDQYHARALPFWRALLSDAKAAADRLEIELAQERARSQYLEGLLERVYNGPGRFGLPRELRDEIAGNIPKAPASRQSG